MAQSVFGKDNVTITPPEGFEPVPEPTNDDYPRSWNWEADGDELQGDYQGSRDVETKHGPQKAHTIVTDKEPVTVWGSAVLNRKIRGAEIGQELWIKRLGKEETQNGRKVWMFEVFVKPAS